MKNLGDGLMVMSSVGRAARFGARWGCSRRSSVATGPRRGDGRCGSGSAPGRPTWPTTTTSAIPVVEAARLCARPTVGEILVADLVRMMVGRHATRTGSSRVGPLELKGLDGPVAACRVRGNRSSASEVTGALPARLVGAASAARSDRSRGGTSAARCCAQVGADRRRASGGPRRRRAGYRQDDVRVGGRRTAHADGAVVVLWALRRGSSIAVPAVARGDGPLGR